MVNNHALRVVTSTAWSTGSKGNTGFDSVFGSSKVAGGTAISVAQMPSHSHDQISGDTSGSPPKFRAFGNLNQATVTDAVVATGGGGTHNHTLSLDLNYINMILATKD